MKLLIAGNQALATTHCQTPDFCFNEYMKLFSRNRNGSKTFSVTSKVTENVGSDRKRESDFGRSRVRSESEGHSEGGGSRPNREQGESLVSRERGGSRANHARDAQPSTLCDGWASKHVGALAVAKDKAYTAAKRDGRPWTLHADQFTRNVLDDCPAREVSISTAAEYRRVYNRLCAEGITAYDKATSKAHWDKLRTACRYCMEDDIRRWRKASEASRKAGDIDSAQRRTERAWRLAVSLEEQFLRDGHLTWSDKTKEMTARGIKPTDKSKRRTIAPRPEVATALLLSKHRGQALAERHAPRLAILSQTGCRPAELRKGIDMETRIKNDRTALLLTIKGAKVNEQRGQSVRTITLWADSSAAAQALAALCADAGGKLTVDTSEADYRSLNRALKSHGLSCYTFRHQMGAELKSNINTGQVTAEQAAQIMGHRSTLSLSYYGTTSRARGGRRLAVGASDPVRTVPVTHQARAQARAGKAKAKDLGFGPRPTQNQSMPTATPTIKPPSAPKPKM